MTDCVFCKIIAGEVPCCKVAENGDFLAFLDIKPFNVGHTMVIPKSHYRWTYEVPNFGEYWEFTKKITENIDKQLHPLSISYLTMGKQVPHAHIHIIPRYENDTLVNEFSENLRLALTPEELMNTCAKIKL